RAREAALRLATLTEEDEVLAREQRILDLREDRFLVADDSGEDALAALERPDEVLADLGLDGARRVPALPQLADGARLGHCRALTMRRGSPPVKLRRPSFAWRSASSASSPDPIRLVTRQARRLPATADRMRPGALTWPAADSIIARRALHLGSSPRR